MEMDCKLLRISPFWLCFICSMLHIQLASGECNYALGLESGAILDHQLSASTSQNALRLPQNGRLHKNFGDGGWYPSSQDTSQYFIINFKHLTRVTAVATQAGVSGGFVEQYKLQYSDDGTTWENYEEYGRTMFFNVTDKSRVEQKNLRNPFEARWMRFNPTKFDDLAMRVEVYGCYPEMSTAFFDGNSYITYDAAKTTTDFSRLQSEYVTFYFMTTSPNAIIFQASGYPDDYLNIQLVDSKLVVTANIGNREGNDGDSYIEAGGLLDDGQWHLVKYKRNGQSMELTVDGTTSANRTFSAYRVLDIDRKIYIGGAPTIRELGNGILTLEPFVGCLQNFKMSNAITEESLALALDFLEEVDRGVKNELSVFGDLSGPCTQTLVPTLTFASEDSYVKWPGPDSSTSFRVYFEFRTFENDTYMILNVMNLPGGGGVFLIGLRSSALTFVVKKSGGPKFEVMLGDNLNDGLWHEVTVEVSSNNLNMQVDDAMNSVSFTSIISTSNFYYIGGSKLQLREASYLRGFRGCLRNIELGTMKLDLYKANPSVTLSLKINGVVEVDSCGVHNWCSPNPCEHGGKCVPHWNSYSCECVGKYSGLTCHTSAIQQSCDEINQNGAFFIDPDGSGPVASFEVECLVDGEDTWTVFSHDAEQDQDIPAGNAQPGSFERVVDYNGVTEKQITTAIDMSSYCEQFVSYSCTSARFLNGPDGPYGWWVGRNEVPKYYWGGAAIDSRRCACGMIGTCLDDTKFCNCDSESTTGQTDEGLLMDKKYLPVTKLFFGDVSSEGSSSASFVLGKLRCKGDAHENNAVTFKTGASPFMLPVNMALQNAIDINFDFKTSAESGVLIAADGKEDTQFIMVKLVSATEVALSFNVGSGSQQLLHTSPYPINNSTWHKIKVTMSSKELTLQFDNEEVQQKTFDNVRQVISIVPMLYVGSTVQGVDSYLGCIRKLQFNGKMLPLRERAKSVRGVLEGCDGYCIGQPCMFDGKCEEMPNGYTCNCIETAYDGSSCSTEIGVQMSGTSVIDYTIHLLLQRPSLEDSIILGFTTSTASGLIFRAQSQDGMKYQEISLGARTLRYSYRFDSGSAQNLEIERDFGDNVHHFVTVNRTNKEITLKVDEYETQRDNIAPGLQFTAGRIFVGNSENTDQNFQGCISRVQYQSEGINILPVKLFLQPQTPDGLRTSGSLSQSQCGVYNLPPPTLPPEPPNQPTMPSNKKPVPETVLTSGDKATIAIVIILLLLAVLLLVFLITRYMHRHKGYYITNEAKGSEFAQDPDMAIMLSDPRHRPEKKKEYYF